MKNEIVKNEYIISKYNMLLNHYPYHSSKKMTRIDMYELFEDFGYKIGVEIGVLRGRNALDIKAAVPSLKNFYCIDPWAGGWSKYHDRAVRRLNSIDAHIMRMTSLEAVDKFSNQSIDFVYIDNGHHYFDDVMMDLIRWTPKVRYGGIISGHDYVAHTGVPAAVQAYTSAHAIAPVFQTHLDASNSFFWVKS